MPKSRKSPLPHSSSSVKNVLTHFKNNIPSKLSKDELKKIVRVLLLVYHPNKCQRNSPRTRQYCHNASASTPRRQTARSGKRPNSILFGHNFAPIWKRPQRRRNRRDCGC